MAFTKVDGMLFKKMVMNGAINLKNHHQEIDELNVFPVPDGDTGINMQMTVMSGVREMNNCESSSIVEIGKVLSRGALMGARGNSGVILSQFFRGIYIGLTNLKDNEINVEEFIDCLVSGYQVAYKAVMEPVEGTILTVVREAAEYVNANRNSIETIEQLLDMYLAQAKISLKNTPNLLKVLKDAGVVDSGGAGFVKIVEGMVLAVAGVMLESNDVQKTEAKAQTTILDADIEFGYCTEFILDLNKPEEFMESDLKTPLSLLGDSLVVVRDENICKVHVHTNNPGRVLNIAQKSGEFMNLKIENMRLQHSQLLAKEPAKERKLIGLVSVCFGDGISQTLKDLGVDYIIEGGQTMNPSTEAFVKAIKEVNADNVVIIPNNSNVIMSAQQAAKLCDNVNVQVLRAKTIAQGYAAMVAYSSLVVFNQNANIDEVVEEMKTAISHVKSGEITYSIRDTELNGIKIETDDYMGILDGDIVVSTKDRMDAAHELITKSLDDESVIVTIFYGNDVTEDEVSELEEYCTNLNDDIDVEIVAGKQDIYSYIIAIE